MPRVGSQAGFTLIEILVAMVLSVIVIGGGIWGIARAFQQSAGSSDRLVASSTAEVGLESLTRDLRQAVTCPSQTTDPGGNAVSGVFVAAPSSTLETIDMCDPAPGLPAQATVTNSSQISTAVAVPVTVLVSWTCNTGLTAVTPTGWSTSIPAETCQRTWASINTTSPYIGSLNAGVSVHGVTGISLYGVLGSSTGTQALPACTTGCSYVLSSGSTSSLSWFGFNVTVAALKNVVGFSNTTTVPGTSPITIRSGAALENYGT